MPGLNLSTHDPSPNHIDRALDWVQEQTGQVLSLSKGRGQIWKFGKSPVLTEGTAEMCWEVGGIETLPTANVIDRISSSNVGDTEPIFIEGFTLAGGNFTLSQQTVVLTGQTPAPILTPLARVQRMYNADGASLLGDVYAYQAAAAPVSGIPGNLALTHNVIRQGEQSLKAAFTTASDEWALLSGVIIGLERDAAQTQAICDFQTWVGEVGHVLRQQATFSSHTYAGATFLPAVDLFIVPPNHDVQMRVVASASSVTADCAYQGLYAKVMP